MKEIILEKIDSVNEQDEGESYLRILDIPEENGEHCEIKNREQIIVVKRMKLDF